MPRFHLLFAAACLFTASLADAQDPATKWMRLWNGKDLAGWRVLAPYWKVDSGMIIGKGALPNHNSFAIPPGTFADFELSIRARLYEKGIAHYTNSGIQYRSRVADTARKILQGPQLDIGDNAAASMYPEGGYGGPGAGSSAACRSAMRMDEWNHYLILANGTKVGHRLNGAVCNDFTNNVPSGVIGLQLHFIVNNPAGATMEVDFKDIFIRPLNNSFVIPDSLSTYLKPDYTAATAVGVQALRPLGARNAATLRILPLGGLGTGVVWAPAAKRGRVFDTRGRSLIAR